MEKFKIDATPGMNIEGFDTIAQILRLEDSNANTPLPGTLFASLKSTCSVSQFLLDLGEKLDKFLLFLFTLKK